ncbi:unnamed protein product [Euphydryas editha]|uniref:Uncharacterized protein n=1 Tax=Euphydryas editha TaxID=104508 RepID=A0AAU9UJX4_EUPED|nr:unnamed protein product [Euphydryas editha]
MATYSRGPGRGAAARGGRADMSLARRSTDSPRARIDRPAPRARCARPYSLRIRYVTCARNPGPDRPPFGHVLDSCRSFSEHFRQVVPKLVAAASELGCLLPNLGGTNAGCRQLYSGILRSIALYGAPVWIDALSKSNKQLLRGPQCIVVVRAIREYRTIPFETACLLADSPLWDLEADVLASIFNRRHQCRNRGIPFSASEERRWRTEADLVLETLLFAK